VSYSVRCKKLDNRPTTGLNEFQPIHRRGAENAEETPRKTGEKSPRQLCVLCVSAVRF
jgi:hypothetical protein